jgi:hypothetical protein
MPRRFLVLTFPIGTPTPTRLVRERGVLPLGDGRLAVPLEARTAEELLAEWLAEGAPIVQGRVVEG